MASKNPVWTPYRMEDVVDVNDAKLSVRNYIEQRDLRCFLGLISNKKKINAAAEFGCGYGRMTQVLTEFASDVVGLEREPLLSGEGAQLIPDIKFIQTDDLSSTVLEDQSTDVITTFTFLQHLIDDKAQAVINEMKRCLKSDGHILICEETDEEHITGDTEDPLKHCTIGRSVERYRRYFEPLTLEFVQPRRIEPGYSRENTGAYMLFSKSGATL